MKPVGGVPGLYLQVTPSGSKSWIGRLTIGGKRRELGLGGYPEVSLSQAREVTRELRRKIRDGIDPLLEKATARAAIAAEERRRLLFKDAVEQYLDTKVDAFSNKKHRAQWRSTLATYAMPEIGELEVGAIEVQDVLRVLSPIWTTKTETAKRLRGRIEAVLNWATVKGHRAGDNPARWQGNLKELLPSPSHVRPVQHQPALSLIEAPEWYADLKSREGIGAYALRFLCLTAARSEMVRGASWKEIDFALGLWTVPATRMKMKREYRSPLSYSAIAILNELRESHPQDSTQLIFPAVRGGMISDMTLSATMKRMHAAANQVSASRTPTNDKYVDTQTKRPAVPHGLRSTFRDWAAEMTEYPGELAELALAHRISSRTEAAYRRGDMIEKRREMMEDWAHFLEGGTTDGR